MLYGRLYGRRYGLTGSGAKAFVGKAQSRNTSGVSLPSLAFGFDPHETDDHIKFTTFQNEVSGGRRCRAVVRVLCKPWRGRLVAPCSPWHAEDLLEQPAGTCSKSGQVSILALSLIPWGTSGEAQIIQLGVVQGEDSVLISACGGVFT